jgi:regulator of RNase E activity RraA
VSKRFPHRLAEPGTEISWTDDTGTPRLLAADANGVIVIHDEIEDAEADASGLSVQEDKPAAPALKEG